MVRDTMKKKKNSCSPLDTYNLEKNPGNKKKNTEKEKNEREELGVRMYRN